MKASVMRQFGDFDVLKYEEIDTPTPTPGHVLVKVLAAGVNRFDHYIREGSVVPELSFPHSLGADAAGEVAQLGEGVTEFEIGKRVIPGPGFPTDPAEYDVYPARTAPSFTLPGLGVWGSYAQYLEMPARFLVRDDTGLPPEQVATLPMVLATASHAVRTVGEVSEGDRVLVQAGHSGSGSMLVQVAKAVGAEVATTVRKAEKTEVAARAGADLVINTSEEDLVERVTEWTGGRGADVVIDNLGGDVLAKSIDAARPGGTIVAYGFAAGPEVRFDIRNLFFGEKVLRGSMASDKLDLEWGLEQVKAGRIVPLLDQALPLQDAPEAHRLIATNQVVGNLVLLPWAA